MTWLLIDANNILHADLYGAGAEHASDIFMARARALAKRFRASSVIAAFDGADCFRKGIYAGYKMQRTKTLGVDGAVTKAKAACGENGIGVIGVDTFEADDIIATLTRQAMIEGQKCIIYSSDRDMHQLLEEGRVTQLRKAKRQTVEMGGKMDLQFCTAADLYDEFQVKPSQWVDYKCLVGDYSDNIEGADGIGEITASRIVSVSGSIDGYYECPSAVRLTDKQRQSMLDFKERLEINRKLITLVRDVELPEYWKDFIGQEAV